jgi:uncharacterized small protein (DUF1192 family)
MADTKLKDLSGPELEERIQTLDRRIEELRAEKVKAARELDRRGGDR